MKTARKLMSNPVLYCALAVIFWAWGMAVDAKPSTARPSTPKIAGIGVTKSQLAQMKRRLAVLNATTNRPVSAAIQVRDAKATFREKFAKNLAALESAETELKPLRDLRKAAKRTEKNLQKIVKTLQQAIKKASDEEEAALYQAIIDLLTEAGAEEGD